MNLSFALLKHAHVWLVLLGLCSFIVRYLWLKSRSERLKDPRTKILSIAIDSALILSGFGMLLTSTFSHDMPSWLVVKLACIILYTGLVVTAFKTSIRKVRRYCAALALFIIIVILYLALTKPLLWG